MIDDLGGRATLRTNRSSGRVRWVWIKANEAATFYRGDRAAAGDTKAAVAVDALSTGVLSHDPQLPFCG
jgi:hypothetical protein